MIEWYKDGNLVLKHHGRFSMFIRVDKSGSPLKLYNFSSEAPGSVDAAFEKVKGFG